MHVTVSTLDDSEIVQVGQVRIAIAISQQENPDGPLALRRGDRRDSWNHGIMPLPVSTLDEVRLSK